MKIVPFLLSRVLKTYRTGFFCMPTTEGGIVTGTIKIPNIGGFSYELSTVHGEIIQRGASIDDTVTIAYTGSCYITLQSVKNFSDYNADVNIKGLAYIVAGTGTAGESVLSGNGKELNILESTVIEGSELRNMLPTANNASLITRSSQMIERGNVNGWNIIIAA